jgi:ribosomal protein S18 acetylase RimI-like enzyme
MQNDRAQRIRISLKGQTMTIIRELQKQDDLHDLIVLSKEFFEEYVALHGEIFQVDDLRDSDIVEFFSRPIESEDSATFVAVVEDRMIGYITVSVHSQAGFYRVKRIGAVSGLMVQKNYRRRGIAGQLFDRAVAFFAEQGVKYYTLYTATTNQGAIRFYEQRGMTPLQTVMQGKIARNENN